MPAKLPKKVNCRCRYKCLTNFSEAERYEICKNYWGLQNYVAQKQFLLRQVISAPTKTLKIGVPDEKRRKNSFRYYFIKNEKIRVCKEFFLKTLCISNGPVIEAFRHQNEFGNYIGQDKRGVNDKGPVNKTSIENEEKIIEHINSFPRLESHYCRKKSKRYYLDAHLSIAKMYELYKDKLIQNNEVPCSFFVYKRIFGTKFNLSFFKPKKDLCITCTRYDNAGRPDNLKDDYIAHIDRKTKAQNAKELDKQRSIQDDTYLVATADMQSTLHIPVSGVGILYYARKLNVQNYTIHVAKPPNEAYCLTWNEINGKRGSTEIASTLNWWISQIPTTIKEVTVYSDTCAGQNRNQYVTAFLVHLIQRVDVHLEIFEQKYLESGHTHMEVDSMHSAIEKEQRNSAVYSMIDWKSIMTRARSKRHRNSAPPYIVKEFTYDEMLDVRALSETLMKNMTRDKDGDKINWLKIKCLRFEKARPGLVRFRYEHEGAYKEFDVFQKLDKNIPKTRNRGRETRCGKVAEQVPREDVILKLKYYQIPKAYNSPIPISEAKKKDLLSLCTKGIIPRELHSWYQELPTGKEITDRLMEPDVTEEDEREIE